MNCFALGGKEHLRLPQLRIQQQRQGGREVVMTHYCSARPHEDQCLKRSMGSVVGSADRQLDLCTMKEAPLCWKACAECQGEIHPDSLRSFVESTRNCVAALVEAHQIQIQKVVESHQCLRRKDE